MTMHQAPNMTQKV